MDVALRTEKKSPQVDALTLSDVLQIIPNIEDLQAHFLIRKDLRKRCGYIQKALDASFVRNTLELYPNCSLFKCRGMLCHFGGNGSFSRGLYPVSFLRSFSGLPREKSNENPVRCVKLRGSLQKDLAQLDMASRDLILLIFVHGGGILSCVRDSLQIMQEAEFPSFSDARNARRHHDATSTSFEYIAQSLTFRMEENGLNIFGGVKTNLAGTDETFRTNQCIIHRMELVVYDTLKRILETNKREIQGIQEGIRNSSKGYAESPSWTFGSLSLEQSLLHYFLRLYHVSSLLCCSRPC